jgi:hypothetical protein
MTAVEEIMAVGAWLALLGGAAARIVWFRHPPAFAAWLITLAVIFFYYSLVLRFWFAETLDKVALWNPEISQLDVSVVLVPIGLLCCWFSGHRQGKALGAVLIVAAFVLILPDLMFPSEYVEGPD